MTPRSILYVEDNDDIRETLTLLLEHEGYRVTAAATANAALVALGRAKYDLVLTDYQLPDEHAGWLLRSAKERGSLGETPVIVLTGASAPAEVEGYRLLRKPISQERLFAAFDAVMEAQPKTPSPPLRRDALLRLRLYICRDSRACEKAFRNLERVLDDVDPAMIETVVHDLSTDTGSWVDAAEGDRVVVVPTLVRWLPAPKVWIAGDLSDRQVVRDAILPPTMGAKR